MRVTNDAHTTWIALLRGINVGGNKMLAMADLRALLESLGYQDVRTHLQSGNAVFTAGRSRAKTLEERIASRIDADFGLDVKVLVRTTEQLAEIVAANPFAGQGAPPKELHVAFLSAKPPADKVAGMGQAVLPLGEYEFGDRVIYLRLPKGISGSKLPNWDRLLGVAVTTRNWNTVSRLRDISAT
jgi:uncharacterized protein (DUF1697 family)